MKILSMTMALLLSLTLHAQTQTKEIPSKEDKSKIKATAEKASSETKRLLRKVGRKSMDETCELNETKENCEKQKAEHKALTEKEAVEGVPAN